MKATSIRLLSAIAIVLATSLHAAEEPWFGAPIPASGEKPVPDCGMTAACVFDAPIKGLERIGTLVVPKASDLPESSNASIGFECIDRGLFDPDRCYDSLAAAGVKWARCQTMWSRCEKQKGVYDFLVLDGVVDNLTRRGIRPWFCVSFGNTLYMTNCYTGAAVGCVPTLYGDECRAAWCAYVRELAKRYKGKVTHWEIWNEPNLEHFWQPSKPNAADYLELVKLTAGVIRKEIPDAKIGGTTSSPGLKKWETEFFELGGASEIDFWCGHAYTRAPERLRSQQRIATGTSYDYVTILKDVRAFLDAHGGKHLEIWQGESGFPSWFPAGHWLWWPKTVCKEGWQSQANQAKWLLRRFITDRRAGIARSSFFQMADVSRHYSMATTTQTHPAEHGIVNGWTYKPKMSYHAFGHYNALLATARHDASIDVSVSPESDCAAPTVATAFRSAKGAPLFVYYTAFDFSGNYTGTCYRARCDAQLSVPARLAPSSPVLVDMLRGGVYSVTAWDAPDASMLPGAKDERRVTYTGLPLVDYPLLLADRSQVPYLAVAAADGGVVQQFIDRAVAAGEKDIRIPKAIYNLDPGKVASIHLKGLKDVTIDFQGSELRGKIRSGMMRLDGCSGVTLKNAAIDYPHCLPFSQGIIRSVGKDGEWDVEIMEGYADSPGGWPIQVYDGKTGDLVNPMRMKGEKIIRKGVRRYSVVGGRDRRGKVGDVVVWALGCQTYGNTQSVDTRAHAVYLVNCGNCKVENFTVYSTPGSNAFREMFGEGGNAYVRCRVVPRDPASDPVKRALPRYRSGSHDAFNSRAVRKGPAIIGCEARQHCDDDVNIHGPYQYVASAKGRTARVFVKDMYVGTLKVGDPVQFVTKDGYSPEEIPVIVEIRPATPTDEELAEMKKGLLPLIANACNNMVEVTFDRDCDALKAGSLFVSQNQGGNGFLLKDCRFGPNRARGFICNASNGTVENCVFYRLQSYGILSRPSYEWLEGGAARNILVKDCTFIGCGVFFGVYKPMEKTPDCHRNISFTGCKFKGDRGTLDVRCCRGLKLDGNTFEVPSEKAVKLTHVCRQ